MTMDDKEDSSNFTEEDLNPKKSSVSENSAPNDIPSELEVNRSKEPLFRKYVAHEINELQAVSQQELIDSGAEELGLSTITTARYLKKMVSKAGLYQRKLLGHTYWIMYKDEIPS